MSDAIHRSLISLAHAMPWTERPTSDSIDMIAGLIRDREGAGARVEAALHGGRGLQTVLWALTPWGLYEAAGRAGEEKRTRQVPFTELGTAATRPSEGFLGRGKLDLEIYRTMSSIHNERCDAHTAVEFRDAFDRCHDSHNRRRKDVPLSCIPVGRVQAHGLPVAASEAMVLVSWPDRLALSTLDDAEAVVIPFTDIRMFDHGSGPDGVPTIKVRGYGFEFTASTFLHPADLDGLLRPTSAELRASA